MQFFFDIFCFDLLLCVFFFFFFFFFCFLKTFLPFLFRDRSTYGPEKLQENRVGGLNRKLPS